LAGLRGLAELLCALALSAPAMADLPTAREAYAAGDFARAETLASADPSAEAQAFAAAIDEFRAAGATVIGVTGGNTDQLRAFSAKHCAGEFPVAAATPELIARYDVSLGAKGGARAGWSDRTTYVIDTDGRIAFVYSDLKPNEHIARSLAAVRSLKRK